MQDLLIRGGTVVDGTGAPGFEADVAIRDGRIERIGHDLDPAEAAEVIDATGLVVCPGFVDIHTHYDAQIIWDRRLSCSPWHGVTTAVLGNCGFGIAPMRPEHRTTAMRTLEKVEGMSFEALSAGLGNEWEFTTFAEYLDVIEQRGPAVNVAALVGHTPLRLWVMGDDATERAATEAEIDEMTDLARGAVAAGAIGLSTSMAATHHGHGGKPVPSRLAAFDETDALVEAVAGAGAPFVQAAMGRGLFNEEFEDLAGRHDVTITWTALLAGMTGKGKHWGYLRTAARQQDQGLRIVPQVACRPIMFEFRFDEPYPFELLDCFAEVRNADRDAKAEAYADPGFRERFRVESAPDARNVNADWAQRCVVSRHDPDPTLEERPLEEIAAERGMPPEDMALELALESDLETRFRFAFLNHDAGEVRDLIRDTHAVITLSDAGAHADQLCDACWSTHLLGHWVRDEKALTLEAAVHALTQRPAQLVGLAGRGVLTEGMAADVVVFAPDTVGHAPLRRVADLPGGAERLLADPTGIHAVVVNGTVLRDDGGDRIESGGNLPGRLLRSGRG
ncbi:MAG: N-acyl-D-amino-acid deacylase family protein [Microthrixaceae bacterium]